MGASPFGYKVAEQFGINVWPTRAGLVPLTLHAEDKDKLSILAGVAVNAEVASLSQTFREAILFTHRGLSGPAILQISSYWQPGEAISINLLPEMDLLAYLKQAKRLQPQRQLSTIMSALLSKRLIEVLLNAELACKKLADLSYHELERAVEIIQVWSIKPNGTEGYRTAEVTLGGVDCAAISSKTMEANAVPGLYFIGETLDVSGWLGGYNFQWAWASGWAAGQAV